MTLPAKNNFDPQFALTDGAGKPTQYGRDYFSRLDALVTALTSAASVNLTNAANDAAAAAAGVPVGALYRNGSVLMARIV